MTKKEMRVAARLASTGLAVVYARVSTEEQAKSGAGVDGQLAECSGYAERKGLTIIDTVIEAAVSGKTLPSSRPGFARALGLLDNCAAGSLLVRRQDRISRNLRHFLAVVDTAKASGWNIVTTDGELDTGTAAGEMHVHMMAVVAEYERKVIGERTREALAAKKSGGMILGRPPVLTPDVLARIVAERAEGQSWRAIAAGLTADGVPTARGGAVWHVGTVHAAAASNLARGDIRQATKPKPTKDKQQP